MHHGDKGFTLIELLIVVAIIALIAAIATPNLMTALDKGRQKKTMADLRALGTAITMYQVDNNTYPRITNFAALPPVLEPTYIPAIPPTDGWNNTWVFQGDATRGLHYTFISYAKDGVPSTATGGQTHDFNCDIIYADGRFFQWPQGGQN
jgi:general secretion pathway protein G